MVFNLNILKFLLKIPTSRIKLIQHPIETRIILSCSVFLRIPGYKHMTEVMEGDSDSKKCEENS